MIKLTNRQKWILLSGHSRGGVVPRSIAEAILGSRWKRTINGLINRKLMVDAGSSDRDLYRLSNRGLIVAKKIVAQRKVP